MNKQNKKRFDEIYLKNKIENYPSFIGKEWAIPPADTKEASANNLTRLVVDFLQFNDCQAERISNTGLYRDNTKIVTDVIGRQRTIGSGTWTKGSGTNGTADISATIKGRSVKIEIKWEKDIQSDAQKKYQADIEKSGGVYVIVKTFDNFIIWYDEFISQFLF